MPPRKSTITTLEAKELLDNGWKLMQFKNTFNDHTFYVKDDNVDYPYTGCCKYINKDVFDNLVKQGCTPHDYMYVEKNDEITCNP